MECRVEASDNSLLFQIDGPQPAILQEVSIPIWTNAECRRKYGPAAPGGIVESMLCAGQPAKDSCSGDSGKMMRLRI